MDLVASSLDEKVSVLYGSSLLFVSLSPISGTVILMEL